MARPPGRRIHGSRSPGGSWPGGLEAWRRGHPMWLHPSLWLPPSLGPRAPHRPRPCLALSPCRVPGAWAGLGWAGRPAAARPQGTGGLGCRPRSGRGGHVRAGGAHCASQPVALSSVSLNVFSSPVRAIRTPGCHGDGRLKSPSVLIIGSQPATSHFGGRGAEAGGSQRRQLPEPPAGATAPTGGTALPTAALSATWGQGGRPAVHRAWLGLLQGAERPSPRVPSPGGHSRSPTCLWPVPHGVSSVERSPGRQWTWLGTWPHGRCPRRPPPSAPTCLPSPVNFPPVAVTS